MTNVDDAHMAAMEERHQHEDSIHTPEQPAEVSARQMREKAKQEAIARMREVRQQILALTPAKLFYDNNPPRRGETGHGTAAPTVADLARDIEMAIEAVERL